MRFNKNIVKCLVCTFLLTIPFEASAATLSSVTSGNWGHGGTRGGIAAAEKTSDGNILAVGNGVYAIIDASTGQTMTRGELKPTPSISAHDAQTLKDGNTLLVGLSGKWMLVSSSGVELRRGQLAKTTPINAVTELKNGNIVMAQHSGYYTIMDSSLNVIRSGTWSHGNNRSSIYDVIELENGNIFMSGQQGRYAVINEKGKTISSGSGEWGVMTHIYDLTRLSDGKILAVGSKSKYLLFDKDGKQISEGLIDDVQSHHWRMVVGVSDNYAVVIDYNGNAKLIKINENNNVQVASQMSLNLRVGELFKSYFRIADNKVFVGDIYGNFEMLEVDTSN